MNRRWITDASPLIVLAKAGHLALLSELPDELVIPERVAEEVMSGDTDDPARQWLLGAGGVHIQPAETIVSQVAAWDLGRGESAVLSLALARRGRTALIDDLAARRCANALGVPFTGTVGVVLAAKEVGLIAEITPVLADLVKAGLRLSPAVLEAAHRLAGEL